MDKVKNFLYDKSDLLVALIIIAIATLVIWVAINNIMDPVTETADASAGTAQSQNASDDNEGASATTDSAVSGSSVTTDGGNGDSGQNSTSGSTQAAQIIITSGETSEQIAEKLFVTGAITDKNTFLSKLEELGMSNKIQEGSFNIPAGSTLEDVCKIITKTS